MDSSFYVMAYWISWWYYMLFLLVLVWLCRRNGCIWSSFGGCYESSAFSTKKPIVAWSLEVALNGVCLILRGFWCIHQAEVIGFNVNCFFSIQTIIRPCNIVGYENQFLFFCCLLWIDVSMCNVNRYLSYVMDVATPTADCLTLVYDLLMPVVMKGHGKNTLSHQEVWMKLSNFEAYTNCFLLLYGSWCYCFVSSFSKLLFCYICIFLVYCTFPDLDTSSNTNLHKFWLPHQNRILGETKDQIEQMLALVFENYKSLDESLPSGIMEVFKPATGLAAPALEPAVKLYTLLHDILSPEAQTTLCHYFQVWETDRHFSLWCLHELHLSVLIRVSVSSGCCKEEIKKALDWDRWICYQQ